MGSRSKSPRNGKSKSRGRSPTPKRGTNSIATPKKDRAQDAKLAGIWDLAQGKKGVPRATQKLGEAIFMFSNSLAAIGIIMVNKTLLQTKERGGFGFNGLTSSLTFPPLPRTPTPSLNANHPNRLAIARSASRDHEECVCSAGLERCRGSERSDALAGSFTSAARSLCSWWRPSGAW